MKSKIQACVFATVACVSSLLVLFPFTVHSHGRMVMPPSRMSAWRFGFDTPTNYNDNQMNCGGFNTQWATNGGKCGICGDNWSGPRLYERPGGTMLPPEVVITETYEENQSFQVWITLTQNHQGWFEFRLCDVAESGGVEATEECLDRTLLADASGKTRFDSPEQQSGRFPFQLVLPQGKTCAHCVLQWKWVCGNNWGSQQEHFYACADVSITPTDGSAPLPPPVTPPPSLPMPQTPSPTVPQPPPVSQPPSPTVPQPPFPTFPQPPTVPQPSSPSVPQPSPTPPPATNPPRPFPQPPTPAPPSRPAQPPQEFPTWRDVLANFFNRNYGLMQKQNKMRFHGANDPEDFYDDTTAEDAAGDDSDNVDASSNNNAIQDLSSYYKNQGGSQGSSSGSGTNQNAASRICSLCRSGCFYDQCYQQCPQFCT